MGCTALSAGAGGDDQRIGTVDQGGRAGDGFEVEGIRAIGKRAVGYTAAELVAVPEGSLTGARSSLMSLDPRP